METTTNQQPQRTGSFRHPVTGIETVSYFDATDGSYTYRQATDPTTVAFEASEIARWDSISERDALTPDEGADLASMEAELAAELRNERWFEDRGAGHCDLGQPVMAPDGSGCLCGCS